MADLARRVVLAAHKLPILDDRRADARADDDVHQAWLATARAIVIFAQRGGFGVVFKVHRHFQPSREHVRQRRVVQPSQVGRVNQRARLMVDRARAAHAEGVGALARRQQRAERFHAGGDALHHTLWPFGGTGRYALPSHDAVLRRDQPNLNLRAAQIDGEHPTVHQATAPQLKRRFFIVA